MKEAITMQKIQVPAFEDLSIEFVLNLSLEQFETFSDEEKQRIFEYVLDANAAAWMNQGAHDASRNVARWLGADDNDAYTEQGF